MEPASKLKQEAKPVENDFYNIPKELKNQSGRPLTAPGSEDWRFCKFFDCSAAVALSLWQALISNHLLSPPLDSLFYEAISKARCDKFGCWWISSSC